MGTAASSSPTIGVALNPRVEYAAKLAQSEGKTHLIDAPVLVDLPDGSVRYRYVERKREDVDSSTLSLHEGPHKGNTGLENKKGYFFHARLADYSTEANQAEREADHKFKYVYRTPIAARNKKLYYVTGKGIPGSDHLTVYSSLRTPTLSDMKMQHGHIYYKLELRMDDDSSIGDTSDSTEDVNSKAPIMLSVDGTHAVEYLKEEISMRILKPASHIHVYYMQREISPTTNIKSLVGDQNLSRDQLRVRLVRLNS